LVGDPARAPLVDPTVSSRRERLGLHLTTASCDHHDQTSLVTRGGAFCLQPEPSATFVSTVPLRGLGLSLALTIMFAQYPPLCGGSTQPGSLACIQPASHRFAIYKVLVSAPGACSSSPFSPMFSDSSSTHVVFLLHGLWGNPTQMYTLREALNSRAKELHRNVRVWCCESYQRSKTFDGVDVCADRAIHEITEKIEETRKSGSFVQKFSILGQASLFQASRRRIDGSCGQILTWWANRTSSREAPDVSKVFRLGQC
jgi:hypothetical protein